MKTVGEIMRGIGRGFRRHCPECGEGPAFSGYLRVLDRCPQCGHDLDKYPADDAPPYVTILAVGHILVPSALFVDLAWPLAQWAEMVLWSSFAALLALTLLPFVKGAVIGFEWGLGIIRETIPQDLGAAPAKNG